MDENAERDAPLLAVLDAMAYEFDMLVVASQLSKWSQAHPSQDPGPNPVPWMNWAHNAHVESYLVHARNLLEFFYLNKQSIRARNFIDGRWTEIRPPFKETFQLSTIRDDHQQATAHDLWHAISTRLSHVMAVRDDKLEWQTGLLTIGFIHVGRVFAANVEQDFVSYFERRPHHVRLREPMEAQPDPDGSPDSG